MSTVVVILTSLLISMSILVVHKFISRKVMEYISIPPFNLELEIFIFDFTLDTPSNSKMVLLELFTLY